MLKKPSLYQNRPLGFSPAFLLSVAILLVSFMRMLPALGQPFTNTVTFLENQKPGTATWLITNPAPFGGIEGYASLTSVNRGGQIKLFVNTTNSFYSLEIYRIGWYDGLGARRVLGPLSVPGYPQVIPTPAPVTGLVECNWTNAFVLDVPANPVDPTDWASGAYLAKLTGGQDGYQSYIIFAVRDDQRATDLLVQFSFTTYEAYNEWGGTGLYHNATKVSFNRPFRSFQKGLSDHNPTTYNPYWNGSGEFFSLEGGAPGWECNLVHWLEREGYDVSYCTSVDTHSDTNLLSGHKAFISAGHDEYWSYAMRQNVQSARDSGVNLAFLSANNSYWQVRFEPGTGDGAANRNVVCYKSTNDPVYNSPSNYLTTVQFRDNPVRNPESSLIGVQYGFNPVSVDMVVNDPTHWAFTNTDVSSGQHFVGLLGYEVDQTNATSPTGIQVACHSPFLPPSSFRPPAFYSQMASYIAQSGATVFAAGSMQWIWGLDDFNAPSLRPSYQSPVAQQVTRNVLARMINQDPPAPTLFFRTDNTTSGNWKPVYGVDGYVLPGDSTNLPGFATVDFADTPVTNCLNSSTDTNSLQKSVGNGRHLANWSATDSFVLDVNLTDSQLHQIALYFWDWNNAGRRQMVEVLDAQSQNLLDRRVLNNFTNGQWWVWQVKGHVKIRVSNLSGPDCLLGAVMIGGGTQAAPSGQDSLTSGNWPFNYGSDGYYIAGGASSPASYATVSFRNSSLTNWSLDSTDPRAPLNTNYPWRPFAAWTAVGNVINAVNIKVKDNAWHQLAVYCVDQDMLGRKQSISLVDPAMNTVLDSQIITNFGGGKYLAWNFRGNIQLRFQTLNQMSAVVSGIFLSPPNQPPSVAISTPTNSQVFTFPASVNLSTSTGDTDGSVTRVSYYANGNLLATVTNSPFDFVCTNLLVGQYSLTALAVDDRLGSTLSSPVSISVVTGNDYQPPVVGITSPLSNSVWLYRTNVLLAGSITSNSAPVSSLQFFVDGNPYGPQLSNAPFSLSITNLSVGRRIVSALAVDASGISTASPPVPFYILPPQYQPPAVTITSPNNGTIMTPSGTLTISAAPICSTPGTCRVDFYANGNLIGSDSSAPYTVMWEEVPAGSYQLTAVVVDATGTSSVSPPVSITVGIPSVANFIGIDTYQQGNWRGAYGASGYLAGGIKTNLPNFAILTANSQFILWNNSTTEHRAPETENGSTRVAAQLYSYTNFSMDLNLIDGIYHRVSLYYMDWQRIGVSQTVDVVDSVTGQTLDHRILGPFINGTYESWNVRGHVKFVVTATNGWPAMASGLFLDASPLLDPISITDPPNGAVYSSPAFFTVHAETLGNPTISRVELYQNTTLASYTTNGPPYTFALTNLPPGTNTLFVRAITPFGSLDSTNVTVNVLPHEDIKITSLTFQPDGTLRLILTGPDEITIRIEASRNPFTGEPWEPIATNVPGQFIFTLPNENGYPQRFYRAAVMP